MEVRFKNFRCFKDTGLLKLKRITLLVGENNSGKTSFIAGLNHMHSLLRGGDITLNTEPFELGSFNDICHSSPNNKKKSTFSYECNIQEHSFLWTFKNEQSVPNIKKYDIRRKDNNVTNQIILNKSSVTLVLTLSDEHFRNLKSARFDITRSKDGRCRIKFPFGFDKRPHPFLVLGRNGIINPRQLSYYLLSFFHDILHGQGSKKNLYKKTHSKLLMKLLDQIERFSPDFYVSDAIAIAPLRLEPRRIYSFGKSNSKRVDPYGENLPAKLLSLSTSKDWDKFSELLSTFGKNAGLFQGIDIEKLKDDSDYPFSIMVQTGNGQTSNLMDVGYGVSQILPLVFELMTNRGNHRYLIQQPEVHLHPKAQAEFASLIATQCSDEQKEIDNGFVIETHSDYMLDRFKYEITKGTISHKDIGILFFEPSEGGKKIHQINLGEDGLPNNAPPSYRRFFLEEMERTWR